MRLDQYLSHMGYGTRSEVKKMIDKKRVSVEGVQKITSKLQITPGETSVFVDGQYVVYAEYVYYMLHKPRGYVCATADREEKTVLELITESNRKLFPAGRLDKETEGFVLVTDDGAFSHKILSPKNHVPKTYMAVIDGTVDQSDVRSCQEGIHIGDDTPTKPAHLEILQSGDISLVLLTIREGRYHQIRRMFHALHKPVIYLKRISIGTVFMDPALQRGQYRPMTEKEVAQIEETARTHRGDLV